MKKKFFTLSLALFCGIQIYAQESTVKILLNEEERFRFDGPRLEFINPGHNVLIGDSVGCYLDNEAVRNTFVGHRAGYHNITGWDNVFIGDSTGYNNLGGYYNTFNGSWAGYLNTEGSTNSFYGLVSGMSNTTGSLNSYYGSFSGYNNQTGSYNSFFGYAAGANNHGNKNVFLGYGAGQGNSGDSSIFIGYTAGKNETRSQRLYIANSETSAPLIYGEFNTKILRFYATRLEMRNPLENTILGDSSGWNTTGVRNVFVGARSGYSNTDGNDNAFIGDSAGYANTSGWENLFIGNWAGYLNTTGYCNMFAGIGAGISNTEGDFNVMLGRTAGWGNTTGNGNVYVGRSSGAYNSEGSCNTFVGDRSGLHYASGDSSVFIGFMAGAEEDGSNKLVISNSATTEPLIYGDFKKKNLKFYADSLETTGEILASGEVRSDMYFNSGGFTGISDTINTVTNFDFGQFRLKYRTSIYTGGIVTYISPESSWVNGVGGFILPAD
jgi:hypothetical protein